jgi:7-carboxy-7-deazaguanine synthase (Cx14CxxC type)
MTIYHVKEVFKTIQGEGWYAGRAAVFCRFTGCNLWSGHEADRAKAICKFCDTDFIGGTKYTADDLAAEIARQWGKNREHRMVVFTGGEPLLQLDASLIALVREIGFFVAVETNGTIDPPKGINWLTVSPKAGAPLVVSSADEIKIVYPQGGLDPESIRERVYAMRYSIQPMDGREGAAAAAVNYIKMFPWWRLSLQTHKFIGIQ